MSLVVVGAVLGAGTGIGMGAADSDDESSLEGSGEAFDGPTDETTATLASASDPQDDFAVVQFENNTVVSGQATNNTPEQAFITHNDDYLVLSTWDDDNPVLQLGSEPVEVGEEHDDKDGSHIERNEDASPDLQVVDSSIGIEIDPEDGTVRTDDDQSAPIVTRGEGDPIIYDNHDEAVLEPEITNVNEPAEGEDLIVDTTITNHGYSNYVGDRTLSWGDESDSQVVNVNPGNYINEPFVIETEEGDSSITEVELEIDGVDDTRDIDIAEAEVVINEIGTTTAIAGEELDIGVEIERIGDVPVDDMTVEFIVENETVETDDLEIDPGDTTEGEISYETSSSDVPEIDVAVEIPEIGESAETEATVLDADDHENNMGVEVPEIEIGNLSEELKITGEFEYDDDIPNGEMDIPTEFLVNGTVVEERDVTIDESPHEETFTYDLTESKLPIENVSLETPGGSNVTEFDRNVTLEFSDLDETFSSSEPLSTTVSVENDGEVPEFQNLTVGVEDSNTVESDATQSEEFLLNASETVEHSFEFQLTADASSGVELTANTSTVSETVTTNRSVFEAADVELRGADDPDSELSIAGNVTNTGELSDTQTVQFVFDGETAAEEELTLEPEQTELVTAAVDSPEESGEYTYGITTNNESLNASTAAERTATIENQPDQSLLDRISPVQFGLLVIGLLAVLGLLLKYQDDPEAFQARAAALTARAHRRAQKVIGGGDTVVIENGLSRDATVRLRVRDSDEVVFLEDVNLADGEQREFNCLPDNGGFEVGAGVDDIDSHAEVFQEKPNGVGVRLEPDGIHILEQ
ncbi:hypothetical protein [Halostagnicola sp. A-GB9-2]|uniref:COG1470 family protein n=1 Tax=Halostagnicola sp. A-GB9-2 TaxID=3048066 RepID=UPI0024BFECB3|nr:hypothetical protein [Halostagnicola sp. A-GB9-2]MDJ1431943.1 hypothetical protein [Halostagnicola sp. A-GB9-2]